LKDCPLEKEWALRLETLPADWQQQAAKTGAMIRKRVIMSPDTLLLLLLVLLVLLLHVSKGESFL